MEDLLVLGLIPGTTIQINFELWLMGILVLTTAMLVNALLHRHTTVSHRFPATASLAGTYSTQSAVVVVDLEATS